MDGSCAPVRGGSAPHFLNANKDERIQMLLRLAWICQAFCLISETGLCHLSTSNPAAWVARFRERSPKIYSSLAACFVLIAQALYLTWKVPGQRRDPACMCMGGVGSSKVRFSFFFFCVSCDVQPGVLLVLSFCPSSLAGEGRKGLCEQKTLTGLYILFKTQ